MIVTRPRRRKLAVLIPAHNEELVIEATIRGTRKAGQNQRDIFVVSDGSSDRTVAIAAGLLGASNVLAVEHSGKAGAVKQAIEHFSISERYTWVHLADADSIFGTHYFKTFRKALNKRYVAVTGYVQSLPGDYISKFRVYEYALAFSIIRRLQAWFGVITVMPGPTACLRTDIIDKLDFEAAGSLTEDFEITLQIHRQKLGKIRYVPKAKTFTQDPRDLGDYIAQVRRWYRGFFQGVKNHQLGRKLKLLDAYMLFMIGQPIVYVAELLLWLPLSVLLTHHIYDISIFFISEIVVYLGVAALCAVIARRLDILAAFPLFYFLRMVNLVVFLQSFVEVMILKRFQKSSAGWSTANRRYAIAAEPAN